MEFFGNRSRKLMNVTDNTSNRLKSCLLTPPNRVRPFCERLQLNLKAGPEDHGKQDSVVL